MRGHLLRAEEAGAVRVPIDAEGPAIPRRGLNHSIPHLNWAGSSYIYIYVPLEPLKKG